MIRNYTIYVNNEISHQSINIEQFHAAALATMSAFKIAKIEFDYLCTEDSDHCRTVKFITK